MKQKKVMVFGTFDIIHRGHFYFLRQSKGKNNFLIVVVARDSTVKKMKGKETVHKENERLGHVNALAIVDKAVLGYEGEDKLKI